MGKEKLRKSYQAMRSACWWTSNDVSPVTVFEIVFTELVKRGSQNLISPSTLQEKKENNFIIFPQGIKTKETHKMVTIIQNVLVKNINPLNDRPLFKKWLFHRCKF